jgi:hypothetical protein
MPYVPKGITGYDDDDDETPHNGHVPVVQKWVLPQDLIYNITQQCF